MTTTDQSNMLSVLAGADPDVFTTRPVIMGNNGMVTSGHYLASRIGLHILEEGGNAIDAGVAMGFALSVLEPYIYGIGGEVPILIYLADENRVVSLCGQGHAPRKATIDWFKKNGIDAIPGDGLLAAAVPDAVSTWIAALSHFGTMNLSQVLGPSVDLADRGFPMYERLQAPLEISSQQFQGIGPPRQGPSSRMDEFLTWVNCMSKKILLKCSKSYWMLNPGKEGEGVGKRCRQPVMSFTRERLLSKLSDTFRRTRSPIPRERNTVDC
jgi:hypothetical protein